VQGGIGSSAEGWAVAQFEAAALGDARRTKRAVRLAGQMARHPAGSIPNQAATWKDAKAAYRLFHQDEVTFEALVEPHAQLTRQLAGEEPVVLMVQDTTQLSYSHRRTVVGLGPIGHGDGWGLLLHSVLAVVPQDPPQVLGVAHQRLWSRKPAPPGETEFQRRKRKRESAIWWEAAQQIGPAPPGSRFVHVCDRGADNFDIFQACVQSDVDYVIRGGGAAKHRRVLARHGAAGNEVSLYSWVRGLPALGGRRLWVRARAQRAARWAKLLVSSAPVTLLPPRVMAAGTRSLPAWVVRVWEIEGPTNDTPIEWVLLTNRPAEELGDAAQIASWYAQRWLIEEYFKCLKSGCAVERRQLDNAERLKPLIGMLAVVAVRLLQLRQEARAAPARPASECVPSEYVCMLAAVINESPGAITVRRLWREVARLGGFLARRSDRDPGWQTLWRGWQKLELMVAGARLAVPDG
jgi:hypothetical protein